MARAITRNREVACSCGGRVSTTRPLHEIDKTETIEKIGTQTVSSSTTTRQDVSSTLIKESNTMQVLRTALRFRMA
jgi:hypothetical protein